MKKQVITVMAVAMFFAALAVASVRSQDAGTISVNIPFDFAVSGKTLSAGQYYLQQSTDGARVVTQIRRRDETQGVYLPQTYPVQEELPKTSKERLLQSEMAKQRSKPET